jgi:hypothetical protein
MAFLIRSKIFKICTLHQSAHVTYRLRRTVHPDLQRSRFYVVNYICRIFSSHGFESWRSRACLLIIRRVHSVGLQGDFRWTKIPKKSSMNARHKSNPFYIHSQRAGRFKEISSLITISIILKMFLALLVPLMSFQKSQPTFIHVVSLTTGPYTTSKVCSPDNPPSTSTILLFP